MRQRSGGGAHADREDRWEDKVHPRRRALGLKGPRWSQRGFEGGKTSDWHFVLPIRRGPLEEPQEGRVA